MDFAQDGQQIKTGSGAIKWVIGVALLCVVGGVGFFMMSGPAEDEIGMDEEVPLLTEGGEAVAGAEGAAKPPKQKVYRERYGKIGVLLDESVRMVKSAQIKANRLMSVEIENERLKLENAKLKEVVVTNQFRLESEEGVAHNRTVSSKIEEEAWTKTGRTPEQIVYQPPTQMTPAQLNTLGISYFNAREDEKAAVIFSRLVDESEVHGFKGPKTLVLAGIAWYRLDNLRKADEYFERALKVEEAPEELPYFAQARMWRGMVYARVGKHELAQQFFHEVLDQHPQSPEAAWINRQKDSQAKLGHPKAVRKGSPSRAVASSKPVQAEPVKAAPAEPAIATERAKQ